MTICPHCGFNKSVKRKKPKSRARKAFLPRPPVNAERDKEIARLYKEGNLTQAQIY